MLKQLIIGFLLIHAAGSHCLAQGAEQTSKTKTASETEKKNGVTSSGSSTKTNTLKQKQNSDPILIAITFTATETCMLKIGEKGYGTLVKGSPRIIKLPVGNYPLFFESSETGLTKHVPSFAVNKDMAKGGTYKFVVSFESPISETPAKKDTLQQNNNTAKTEEKPVLENKPISPEEEAAARMSEAQRAIISRLASEMVSIPGGSFKMGAERGLKDETPHTVTVRALNFGIKEITQEQWETIMGYNNSGNKGCSDCPVENISWMEVDSFIRKINTASKKKFRLPTEAEWEYVAKRGIDAAMGKPANKEFQKKLIDFYESTAWYASPKKSTQPVGRKQPVLGVFDLFGNVAEWCSDYYTPDYQNDNPDNPVGLPSGERKVVKGGSFKDDESSLYPPARDKEKPSATRKTLGFRLVMPEN